MRTRAGAGDTYPMKKFVVVVLAIMAAVIVLKVAVAVVSALFGLALFAAVVALVGFGGVAVYRRLSGTRTPA